MVIAARRQKPQLPAACAFFYMLPRDDPNLGFSGTSSAYLEFQRPLEIGIAQEGVGSRIVDSELHWLRCLHCQLGQLHHCSSLFFFLCWRRVVWACTCCTHKSPNSSVARTQGSSVTVLLILDLRSNQALSTRGPFVPPSDPSEQALFSCGLILPV
jgi:hypothetical protein